MSLFLSDACSDWSTELAPDLHDELELMTCTWSNDSRTRVNDSAGAMSMSLFSSPQKLIDRDIEDPFINSATCSSFDTSTPRKRGPFTIPDTDWTQRQRPDKIRRTIMPDTIELNTKDQHDDTTVSVLLESNRRRNSDEEARLSSSIDISSDEESNLLITNDSSKISKSISDSLSWSMIDVLELKGCEDKCVTEKHGLSEFDILLAHSMFSSKDVTQQRQWLFDYFSSNCPNDLHGKKHPKSMKFMLCGKELCLPSWLTILSVSSSRFYEVRKEYLNGKSNCAAPKKVRSISAKSCQAIAWLASFFERIGDKRPDKDGIFLPTCLTEKSIYNKLIQDLYSGDDEKAISFSQFNRLFRTEFSNVTIPKV